MVLIKVPFILVTVPLRKNCISLCSSSSTLDFIITSRWHLFIVSKAAGISMPEIMIVVSPFSAFLANHLCVQITSAVLRSGQNPLWFFDTIPQPVMFYFLALNSIGICR